MDRRNFLATTGALSVASPLAESKTVEQCLDLDKYKRLSGYYVDISVDVVRYGDRGSLCREFGFDEIEKMTLEQVKHIAHKLCDDRGDVEESGQIVVEVVKQRKNCHTVVEELVAE